MKIYIVSDHRGFKLKEELKKHFNLIDLGCNSDKSVDYPLFAFKLGEKVANNNSLGIAICGSGIGISIACNKVKGIRCAKVNTIRDTIYTKKDNNANVIAISGEMSINKAIRIVEEFINTEFSNEERHIKRINEIEEYEKRN